MIGISLQDMKELKEAELIYKESRKWVGKINEKRVQEFWEKLGLNSDENNSSFGLVWKGALDVLFEAIGIDKSEIGEKKEDPTANRKAWLRKTSVNSKMKVLIEEQKRNRKNQLEAELKKG